MVRVRYSFVSVGTELAGLAPPASLGESASVIERGKAYGNLAGAYLRQAMREPRYAVKYCGNIARRQLAKLAPKRQKPLEVKVVDQELVWDRCNALEMKAKEGGLRVTTDDSEFSYQIMSKPIGITEGHAPIVEISGEVSEGLVSIGLLNDAGQWIGSRNYDPGRFEDRLIFDPKGAVSVTLVVANAGLKKTSRLTLDKPVVLMAPPASDGLPHSELDQQGWNLGYSVAGEVVDVAPDIEDIAPGDLVACGGAGLANHADYVCVPRMLACKLPQGCDLKPAASATVGAIALQGVRRAKPQLGERVAVLGLGLIGQITAQLLKVNGCKVIGLDLDEDRVKRALELGMYAGHTDPDTFKEKTDRLTQGLGVDITIITAATKSDAVINQAMAITRRKGKVVVVGDVGLNINRADFYRKELDLLMSTSYGPGRYDRCYENDGRDYPFSYVRWTLNRNIEAYLDLIASGGLDINALIDKDIPVADAPEAYRELADSTSKPPLGVVISYPEDESRPLESDGDKWIRVRGHRKAPEGLVNYALVGVGAFGVSMLVPQLNKCKDRFFLKGVVSRDTARGGNFARANQVEVLTADLASVLNDPQIHMLVIATRHNEHAQAVIAGLLSGKHIFVEKPLALSWEELDSFAKAYDSLEEKPVMMVGFNRRFSPPLQKLGRILADRVSPVIINYRLNGGYIPKDSWIQGPEGGGRNLGEACHMYDVFRFLAASPAKDVTAQSVNPRQTNYLRNDNFSATISYEDGSIGSLLYTAMGPKKGLAKERIEVYCDGECYLVDDFKKLIRTSDQKILWESNEPDKGHFEEIRQVGQAIANSGQGPIPVAEIIETTAVSLEVEDQVFERLANEIQ